MDKKSSKADKMYKNGPTLEKDDDGKPYIKKPEPEEVAMPSGDSEGEDDSMPVMTPAIRHAQERRDMYNRHETEHSIIDTAKGDSKKEMMARHVKELGDMNKRHEKETGMKTAEI